MTNSAALVNMDCDVIRVFLICIKFYIQMKRCNSCCHWEQHGIYQTVWTMFPRKINLQWEKLGRSSTLHQGSAFSQSALHDVDSFNCTPPCPLESSGKSVRNLRLSQYWN